MAKLTKQQRRLHSQAEELLRKPVLNDSEKEFVFEHWHEGANHINGDFGAFFTPIDLSWDIAIAVVGEMSSSEYAMHYRVIDLCSGIGSLSYPIAKRYPGIKLVCVDANPAYVEVGKKLVPEAEWHCIDLASIDKVLALGQFDYAVSNPPYGNVRSLKSLSTPRYSGGESEFKVMEVAAMIARVSTFLVPSQSSPHQVSGTASNGSKVSDKLQKFLSETGLELSDPLSIDTSLYSDFKDLSIRTEVVEFDSYEYQQSMKRGTTEDMFAA